MKTFSRRDFLRLSIVGGTAMVIPSLRNVVYADSGEKLEKTKLNLGIIPLTDCAPIVIAHEKGYFKKYGLETIISKEASWANIRDKVSLGALDGAHMLAGMPIAATLGVGTIAKPTITAYIALLHH
jgi:two-component system, oxyanion-binding sensor